MNIVPLRDELVVRALADKEISKTIHVINRSNDYPQRGQVLAVGPGKMLETGEVINSGINEGDYIYFMRNAGHKLELDDRSEVLVMHPNEVIGIIK